MPDEINNNLSNTEVPTPETGSVSSGAENIPVEQKYKKTRLKSRGKNMVPNEGETAEKYNYIIKNKRVNRDSKARKVVLILIIFLLLLLILGGGLWGFTTLLDYNNFRVMIDRQGGNIFTLSDTTDFEKPSEMISIAGPTYMDNTTLTRFDSAIPVIEETNGSASGESYIAATFFLKNVSGTPQTYKETVTIADVSRNVDKALRVMVIKTTQDGTRNVTVYAAPKLREDGTLEREEVVPYQHYSGTHIIDPTQEERIYDTTGQIGDAPPIWLTEPFFSDIYVVNNTGIAIADGEVVKYTIVIWLEGWDDDCINDKLGGKIKLEYYFTQE